MCACVHVWQSNSHLRVFQVCEVDIAVVAPRRGGLSDTALRDTLSRQKNRDRNQQVAQLFHRVRQLRQRDLQTRYSRCCCLFTGDFSFLATLAPRCSLLAFTSLDSFPRGTSNYFAGRDYFLAETNLHWYTERKEFSTGTEMGYCTYAKTVIARRTSCRRDERILGKTLRRL